MVAQAGIEPATQGFSVLCYYHLSYRAISYDNKVIAIR